MDYGITEFDFWEMTIGEVDRAIQSKIRVRKMEAQERASYDYIQASLIIKGFSIVMGSKEQYPSIGEAYPGIMDEVQKVNEEKVQKRKEDLSVLRFKQFAQSYNKKYDKEVLNKRE